MTDRNYGYLPDDTDALKSEIASLDARIRELESAEGEGMVWTREKPTPIYQPEWYWWRQDAGGVPECVMVGLGWEPGEFGVSRAGHGGLWKATTLGGEWAGPIPLPRERETT
jgi:hypothetical protein